VKVQRIVLPYSGRITWIVLDDGFSPVEPIQDFLAYLNNIERSPGMIMPPVSEPKRASHTPSMFQQA
jgi:hypothetical protein